MLNIQQKEIRCVFDFTLSLVSICARFLWTILTMPGGWIQASPSTCTGTPSSPRMVIFTWRHWDAAEQKTAAVRRELSFFFCLPCIESFPLLDLLRPLLLDGELFMWSCHAHTSEGTSVCYIWWHGVFVPERPKTVFHVFLWLHCHVDMFTKGTNKRNNI